MRTREKFRNLRAGLSLPISDYQIWFGGAARDPSLLERTGKVAIAAEIAAELGVRDVDGRQPAPLTLETA